MMLMETREVWGNATYQGFRQDLIDARRATYPKNPDPDTVAIAEHYGFRYCRARIVKAFSFGMKVTPQEISALAGISESLVVSEVKEVHMRLRCQILSGLGRDRMVHWWLMQDARCCAEIRDVIRRSWNL